MIIYGPLSCFRRRRIKSTLVEGAKARAAFTAWIQSQGAKGEAELGSASVPRKIWSSGEVLVKSEFWWRKET
jgi:hypothetical protein